MVKNNTFIKIKKFQNALVARTGLGTGLLNRFTQVQILSGAPDLGGINPTVTMYDIAHTEII